MDTSIWAGLLAESPSHSHSPRRKSPTWFTWGCLISAHIFTVNYKWICIVLYSYRSPISQNIPTNMGVFQLYPCRLRMFWGPKLYTISAQPGGSRGSLCLVDRLLRQMLVAGLRTFSRCQAAAPTCQNCACWHVYIWLVVWNMTFIFSI